MAKKIEKETKIDEVIEVEEKAITKEKEVEEDPMASIRAERQRKVEVRNRIKKENVEVVMMNTITTGQVYYKCPRTGTTYEFNEFGDTDYFDYEVLSQMKNEHPKMLTDYVLVPVSVMHEDITLEEVLEVLGLDKIYDEDMLYEDNLDTILNMNEKSLERILDRNHNEKYLNRLAERAIAKFKIDKIDEEKLAIIMDYVPNGESLLVDVTEDKLDGKLDKVRSKRKKK